MEPISIAGPHFKKERAEIELEKERLAMGEIQESRVNAKSETYKAIKRKIFEMVTEDYMQSLKSKRSDYAETQYARGAIDALEGLLDFCEGK